MATFVSVSGGWISAISPHWKREISLSSRESISCGFLSLERIICFFISNREEEFLPEIMNGEYWRAFTPVFLHFNFIHILFNGLWMKDLGSLIEHHKGWKFYLSILFISGLLSNLGQFFVKGPYFGGLSGVVYALLGFIWMNKRFDKEAKYSLPRNYVLIMIGWFFLCFTGVFWPIANTAHGVGIAIGMLFGIYSGSQSSKAWNTRQITIFSFLALFFGAGTFAFEFFILPMITKG